MTVEVLDASLVAPSTIIHLGDNWSARVNWRIDGPGVPGTAGDWHVTAWLEQFGPGFEDQVGTTHDVPVDSVPLNPGPPQNRQYSETISIPGAGAGAPALTPGVYRLVTMVTHTLPGPGAVPDAIAGFIEGPFLQFYA
jgi:hypothetical protein